MPHLPVNEAPGFRRIRASPVEMRSAGKSWARRQGCDGDVDVWKRVAAEEHQVRVTLVDPKGEFYFAVQIAEPHTSEAIRVPLKICKCVVELYRADPFRLAKIVFGSLPASLRIGRPRSSDCSTVRPGTRKIKPSIVPVPRVRYG